MTIYVATEVVAKENYPIPISPIPRPFGGPVAVAPHHSFPVPGFTDLAPGHRTHTVHTEIVKRRWSLSPPPCLRHAALFRLGRFLSFRCRRVAGLSCLSRYRHIAASRRLQSSRCIGIGISPSLGRDRWLRQKLRACLLWASLPGGL
jgi:hypothetical protein